jgi:hypothetical protein
MSNTEDDPKLFGISITFLDGLAALLTIIGSLGIVVAAFQYISDAKGLRVERTLTYIERWESDGAKEAYDLLARALALEFEKIPANEIHNARENGAFRKLLLTRVTENILVDSENQNAFETVTYFFNSLGLCLEGRICDKKTVQIFFGGTAAQFMEYFAEPLDGIVEPDHGYGSGLSKLRKIIDRR